MTSGQQTTGKSISGSFRRLFKIIILLNFLFIGTVGILFLLYDYTLNVSEKRESSLNDQKQRIKGYVDYVTSFVLYRKNMHEKPRREMLASRLVTCVTTTDQLVLREGTVDAEGDWIRAFSSCIRPGENLSLFITKPDGTPVMTTGTLFLRAGQNTLTVFFRETAAQTAGRGESFVRLSLPSGDAGDKPVPVLAMVTHHATRGLIIGLGACVDVPAERTLQDEILAWISSIRYDDDQYLFAGRWDGHTLAGPGAGKNMIDVTDSRGMKVVRELIQRSREGGGFIEYVMPDVDGTRQAPKLSYANGIPGWEWYIGTGVYIEKIDRFVEKERNRLLTRLGLYLLALLLLLLAGSVFYYLIVRRATGELTRGFAHFSAYFDNSARDYKSMDAAHLHYTEFITLANAVNRMISEKSEIRDQLLESIDDHDELIHEIRILKNYLSSIIESMPSIIIAIDRDSVITSWNLASESLTGSSYNEVMGRSLWSVLPKFQWLKPMIKDVLDNKKVYEIPREEIVTDGDKKIFGIGLYPITGDDVAGVVIRMDDRTEVELKDEQLRQAQKMEIVGNLAGGLAHDFNNVLGGIVGSISILGIVLDREKLEQKDKIASYITTVKIASDRATEMVRQLLTLARRNEVRMVPVDINDSLKHVIDVSLNSFDKSVTIESKLLDRETMTFADPTQLEQVFLNLMINASHAMTIMRAEREQWGGSIRLAVEELSINPHNVTWFPGSKTGKRYWAISINDSGVGISRENLEKLYDPFFTTKDKSKGTGLGLSMVYTIVHRHNGFILVNSNPGSGSTFTVYLPVLTEPAAPVAAIPETPDDFTGSGTILLIDDEKIIRDTMSSILVEYGYQVMTAENGMSGIELVSSHRGGIDLVICDLSMPVLSGIDTFRKIREIDDSIPVLMSSGMEQNEQVQKAMELGVSGFIGKPFDAGQLAKKVWEFFNR